MGNVWRILGIVLISMVLGLTSLFLLLFTICGGFSSSGGEGAAVVLVTGALIVCSVAGIVWLGRGIAASRTAPDGLAVAPACAGDGPISGGAPAFAAPRPAQAALAGSDLQLLIFLRILLVAAILFTLGTAATSFIRYQGAGLGSGLAIQLVFSSLFGVLPAILLVLTLRNPPAGLALDAIAGMGIAGILWRVISFGAYGMLSQLANSPELATYLMRMALFTLLDAAIAGLAIALRRKVDTTTFARLIPTTAAFLVWEWLTQMMWRLFV
jgi:hypothetical protein